MLLSPSSSSVNPEEFNLKIDSYAINRVPNIKFLGVIIDEKLEWSPHIEELKANLRRLVGIFYKISPNTPYNIMKLLYFALVHSKLIYGIEIYANTYLTNLHDLIILNNRILRITQKTNRYTHVQDLYLAYKILPINKLFDYRLLLHAHAVINKSENMPSFFHDTFVMNNQIHEHNTRSQQNVHRTSFQTPTGRKTTTNLCSQLWNALPNEIKQIGPEIIFKNVLKNFSLEQLSNSR